MRFCSLGSGSSGNATLVEVTRGAVTTRLLIDCGLPYKLLVARLAIRGLALTDLNAVFVTHEHSDHVGCARQLAVQAQLPIWMSRGTFHAIGKPDLKGRWRVATDDVLIDIQDLCIHPFTVAHDAQEPLQLTVTDGHKRFGLLTDLGHITPHVTERLQQLDALVLECNHDETLLAETQKYPPFLKQRIAGSYGHLSNVQAAACLGSIEHTRLKHVVAAHLSEENNSPHLAKAALAGVLNAQAHDVWVADALTGLDWLVV